MNAVFLSISTVLFLLAFRIKMAASANVLNWQLGWDVFKNYTQVIPICNDSVPVIVTVNLFLYQIVDINLQDQVATLNLWLDVIWKDCTLTWDGALYNINTTQFPNSLPLWLPDVAWQEKDSNIEYVTEYYMTQPKQIKNDGSLFMTTQLVPTISCNTDAYPFPFDSQSCTVTFFSVNYDIGEVNVSSLSSSAVMDYFQEDGRWTVESFNATWSLAQTAQRKFATVTYKLNVRRKVLYYAMFVASPLVIFTIVVLFVFAIPAPTEEKISYSTNVLLNVCMYFLSLIAYLPVQSDIVPLIGQYLGGLVAVMAACVIATVFTIKLYWTKEVKRKSLPAKVTWLFNQVLARCLYMPWTLEKNKAAQKQLYEMQLKHFNTHVVSAMLALYQNFHGHVNANAKQAATTRKHSAAVTTDDNNDAVALADSGMGSSAELDDSRLQRVALSAFKRWRRFARKRAAQRHGVDWQRSASVITLDTDSNVDGVAQGNEQLQRAMERKKKSLFSRRKHKPNMTRHQYFAPCRAHWKRTAGNPWSRLSYVVDRLDFFLFLAVSVVVSVVFFFIHLY